MKNSLALSIVALLFVSCGGNGGWKDLLDEDLSQWRVYQSYAIGDGFTGARPVDEKGEVIPPIGYDVNLDDEFRVVKMDGENVLHISGKYYGCVFTKESFGNYHLKLKVKFGEDKFEPRKDKAMDSGLLYHSGGECGVDYWLSWMRSHEFQVCEGGTDDGSYGDYWNMNGTQMDIRSSARYMRYPGYSFTRNVFNPDEPLRTVGGMGGGFCGGEDYGSPHGEWTELELICFEDKAIHIVNGNVKMVLENSSLWDGEKAVPLTSGQIQLQSEAAEVYYKDIRIRPIKSIPDKYKDCFREDEPGQLSLALYSVQRLDSDLEGALEKLSAMGIRSAEIANYTAPGSHPFGLSYEALKETFGRYGIRLLSSNTTPVTLDVEHHDECLSKWEQVISDHEKMGCKYLALSMNYAWGEVDRVEKICSLLNEIGKKAKEHGIEFLYHNHNIEFNTITGTDIPIIDFLMEHTDGNLVNLQCDVFWAMTGGRDPLELLKKYPDRIHVLHLKDNYILGETGKLDFRAILDQFHANGYSDYFIEMEREMTQAQIDAMAGFMWNMARNSTLPEQRSNVQSSPAVLPDPGVLAEELEASLLDVGRSVEYLKSILH